MATATHEAPIDWVEGGYLFVVPLEHVSTLEANHVEALSPHSPPR